MGSRGAGTSGKIAILLGVLATVLLSLRGLDQVPRVLAGPLAQQRFATVSELELALGERLALPAYFPESLTWPPSTLERAGRAPSSVVLGFRGRDGDRERLYLAQTVGGAGKIHSALLPGAVLLDSHALEVSGHPGSLARLNGAEGARWYELRWEQGGRTLLLRSSGSLEELLRMAQSVRREGP